MNKTVRFPDSFLRKNPKIERFSFENMVHRKILTPREKEILICFADTLIPPSPRIPFRPSELKAMDHVETVLLRNASPNVLKLFRWVLRYIEQRARFFRFCGKRFTRMSEKLRVEYLKSYYESRWTYRQLLFRLVEANVISAYYSQEAVAKQIGYSVKLPIKKPSQSLYSPGVKLSIEKNEELETDICVIGSGAGGAPLAAALASAGKRVLILEEGGRFDLNDFKGDAVERTAKMYRDFGLTAAFGKPFIPIMTGKTIGGTTTVNSGTCFRLPEAVFEKWRNEYGLSDLSVEALNPHFDKVEEVIHVMDVPEELLDPSSRIFRQGLEKLGLHGQPLKRNVKSCEGSSLCCFGCPTDAKQSMQLNYIPQALEHGAQLYGYCRVEKIEHESGKVTRVLASMIDPVTGEVKSSLRIKAKTFVLAAGALQTPLLLQASGIAKQSKALGRNLTLHPAGKALALFDQTVQGWQGVPQSFYCADYKKQGIMFEGAFMPPSINALSLLVRGKEHKEVMDQFEHVASFGFLISDESRGRVWRAPNGDRIVFYSLNKADLKRFVDAIEVLCRVFFEAGAKKVYIPVHPLPVLNSADEISKLQSAHLKAKDLEVLSFHPLGTCCMGIDPKTSVVNSYGKVHEMENLFISDGSIFPSSLGVNPQITIMAFSSRIADYIRKNC